MWAIAGDSEHVVTVMNSSTSQLLAAFLVFASAQHPRITQKFVVEVPIASDDVVKKRIPVKNPYAMPRTFRVSTSRADVVRAADDVVNLGPLQNAAVDVFFLKFTHRPVNLEALLFISNAETNIQEEAYSILVKYV